MLLFLLLVVVPGSRPSTVIVSFMKCIHVQYLRSQETIAGEGHSCPRLQATLAGNVPSAADCWAFGLGYTLGQRDN